MMTYYYESYLNIALRHIYIIFCVINHCIELLRLKEFHYFLFLSTIVIFQQLFLEVFHNKNNMHAYFYIVDNGTREGLDKFLKAASSDPETVLHYEFMQDYKVWFLCILLFAFYYFGPKLYIKLKNQR